MKAVKGPIPVAAAVLALVIAVSGCSSESTDESATGVASPETSDTASDNDWAAARTDTAVEGCPTDASASAAGPLAGVTVDCLATGEPIDAGLALAGSPALINLWAYWCAPCARELPILQEFADRAGPTVRVLTVHRDMRPAAALARLADYGVSLETLQDPQARIATALGAPEVLPVTVLLRPDGSVAAVHAGVFQSVDEVAALANEQLGVRV